jgi:hypothetical protein
MDKKDGVFWNVTPRLVREADQSPPSGAEVKNGGIALSLPPHVFMAWYLIKHRDNFNFFTWYSARRTEVTI